MRSLSYQSVSEKPLHNFSCFDLHKVQARAFKRETVQLEYKITQTTLRFGNNEFVIKTASFLS